MKWIALAPFILFLVGCGCCTNTEVVQYRNTSYTPSVIVTPTYYDPITVVDTDPIDVTTTTIDYY